MNSWLYFKRTYVSSIDSNVPVFVIKRKFKVSTVDILKFSAQDDVIIEAFTVGGHSLLMILRTVFTLFQVTLNLIVCFTFILIKNYLANTLYISIWVFMRRIVSFLKILIWKVTIKKVVNFPIYEEGWNLIPWPDNGLKGIVVYQKLHSIHTGCPTKHGSW